MKSQRVRPAAAGRLVMAAAAAIALLGGVAGATTASAQPPGPGYLCAGVYGDGDGGAAEGFQCEAVNAPRTGPIFGDFHLWSDEGSFLCSSQGDPSGFADAPVHVVGRECYAE